MKKRFQYLICFFLLLAHEEGFSQPVKFNYILKNSQSESIVAMAQDQRGHIWFTAQTNGLKCYDGKNTLTYTHDPSNTNSLSEGSLAALCADNSGFIWIGNSDQGLDKFDPATNTFTHFRHQQKNNSSLGCDSITTLLEDHLGNLWIGTFGGLDMLDKKTGKFIHYTNKPGDKTSLSYNWVRVIYEDKSGDLWIGCGAVLPGNKEGGLNYFDRATGKFTQFLHDPGNEASLVNNKVSAILEDSKGNFWVGTAGNGLHTLDRKTGFFTHYYYDAKHPEKLSRPIIDTGYSIDYITFIKEDMTGAIWIGSLVAGVNRYDPQTKKIIHFGGYSSKNRIIKDDGFSAFKEYTTRSSLITKDGLLWIGTVNGELYSVEPLSSSIAYYPGNAANSFFYDNSKNILWIATDNGLVRKNLDDNTEQRWVHDAHNKNFLSNNVVSFIRMDNEKNFWLATDEGLCKFSLATNEFTIYKNDKNIPGSISSNLINQFCFDGNGNLWIGLAASGLAMLDVKTGLFTNYWNDPKDSNSISNNFVNCVTLFQKNKIWAGTTEGLDLLDISSKRIRHFLPGVDIKSVCIDSRETVWAAGRKGLFYYDVDKNIFKQFEDLNTQAAIDQVLDMVEDNQKNLWVTTSKNLIRINARRDQIRIFSERDGIQKNDLVFTNNLFAANGQLFIGDQNGYYAFFPERLKDVQPQLNITGFKLGDEKVMPGPHGILPAPIWQTNEISLNHSQKTFSFGLEVINLADQGEKKYLYRLENYDNDWHNLGNQQNVSFYNLPPGKYIFHARGVSSNGLWTEKKIAIEITPPWWKSWWAYVVFAAVFVGLVWSFIAYRSRRLRQANKILENKVETRTAELKRSLEELKSTQTQLIHAEKMASLGELTAGIAHEIQNPLNFVNNFSEVSHELIDEMTSELDKGDVSEATVIAGGVKQNLEKILHHGKRAEAIVKGMLQHSRGSSGQKEPTDINELADEYLRLAYHGLRAKDKTFNAKFETIADSSIGKLNIVPQDIGRVILNLINNAFYAVTEKSRTESNGYEPSVIVTTQKQPGRIEIRVKDNGNGIPEKIRGKIFQPFFTTKPTGEGTGLGLSMSYDIVTKGHGGNLKLETKEGEGSEFIIELPVSK